MRNAQPVEGGNDFGQGPVNEMSAARSYLALISVPPEKHSGPVQLRLVEPARAHGQRLRLGDELDAYCAGHETFHATGRVARGPARVTATPTSYLLVRGGGGESYQADSVVQEPERSPVPDGSSPRRGTWFVAARKAPPQTL